MAKHKCPKCGSRRFLVSAHVVQGWEVDLEGNFLRETDPCEQVTHTPDDDDIWTCSNCGFDAPGSEFVVTDAEAAEPYPVPNFRIPVKITGYVDIDVCAEDKGEASRLAEGVVNELNFGPLSDIQYEVVDAGIEPLKD